MNEPADTPQNPAEMRRTALYLTLAQVPEGCVVSYGELAHLAGLGGPHASWAVR